MEPILFELQLVYEQVQGVWAIVEAGGTFQNLLGISYFHTN